MVWTLLNIQHLTEKGNRALHFVLELHFQVYRYCSNICYESQSTLGEPSPKLNDDLLVWVLLIKNIF